jgi:ferredoxin-NADP reductase
MTSQQASPTSTAERLIHWISASLFNNADARDYFEPLVNALSPLTSLKGCKASLQSVRRETHDTTTFILRPHGSWTGFRPGQHIDIEVEINGRRLSRTFSIASTPRHWLETGLIELTIKRNDSGKVSRWLQESAKPGLVIGISGAKGDFVPDTNSSSHTLYLAAGSGLTPVMSHLRSLAEPPGGRTATLIYYARTPADALFASELRAMADAHPGIRIHIIHTGGDAVTRLSSTGPGDQGNSRGEETHEVEQPAGRISRRHLATLLGDTRPDNIMVCGPLGFVDAARVCAADAGLADVHFVCEAFGGARPVSRGNGDTRLVNFNSSGKQITGSDRVTLLELAEDHGLRPTAGCRMGICHTCKCTKVSGKVRNILTQEVSDEENESIQLCISVPESDITLSA